LRGRSLKPPQRVVAAKLDLGSAGDDLLEREPPQFAVAIGIVGRHVERERQRAALEQGKSVFEIVAIAVVEGEAGEAPVIALFQSLHRLVKGEHIESGLLHLIEHRIEEVRRHLEYAIGRQTVGPMRLGPNMVQREDHAHPLRIEGEQAVSARVVQTRHRRLHHGGFHSRQNRSPPRAINH
jgi:hypothetical protein